LLLSEPGDLVDRWYQFVAGIWHFDFPVLWWPSVAGRDIRREKRNLARASWCAISFDRSIRNHFVFVSSRASNFVPTRPNYGWMGDIDSWDYPNGDWGFPV